MTRDDIDSLTEWRAKFSSGTQAALVFVYELGNDVEMPLGTPDRWEFRGQRYLFRAVEIDAYRQAMKQRSPRWRTVDLSTRDFIKLVTPVRSLFASCVERPIIEQKL